MTTEICKALGVPMAVIRMDDRRKEIVAARIVLAYELRKTMTLSQIAEIMNKHHTTVMHYLQSYDRLCPDLDEMKWRVKSSPALPSPL